MPEANPAEVIIGVDTHKHAHAAVALTALGARLRTITIPASRKGYQELEAWAQAFGPVRAYGVEGSGSYGAGLSRFLQASGHGISRARAIRSTQRGRPARC
jgi:transposase